LPSQVPTSLYLVPTPIGNLADITLRALEIIKSVDVILAEDTRHTHVLLNHYQIEKPLESFHSHNEHKKVRKLVQRMQQGTTMALLTDAGTPGISDPGFLIVRECLQSELPVECLPGATAFVPALIKSGFPSDRFVFEGFLPPKKGRAKRLEALVHETRTIVLYESRHRLLKTLLQLSELLGDRQASVSRELTKIHEETLNGKLDDLVASFQQKEVKGEFVIVVCGAEE